mgnify:FL=1
MVDRSVNVGTADVLSESIKISSAGQCRGRVDGLADLRVSIKCVIVVGVLLVDGERGVNVGAQALLIPSLILVIEQQAHRDVSGGAVGEALGVAQNDALTRSFGADERRTGNLAQGIGEQFGAARGGAVDKADNRNVDLGLIGHAQHGHIAVPVLLLGDLTGGHTVIRGHKSGVQVLAVIVAQVKNKAVRSLLQQLIHSSLELAGRAGGESVNADVPQVSATI